jgi:two-component system, cell cycle sensor histidine kinase and response regulator CckA
MRRPYQDPDPAERHSAALDAAGVGAWSWDPTTGETDFSANYGRVLGIDPGDLEPGLDGFLGRVHPDDRDRLAAAVERTVAEGGAFEEEFRVVRPGGDVAWFAGKGRMEPTGSDAPPRMFGVTLDITGRKRAEEALRANEARLAEAQRIAHIGSFEWDVERGILLWSDEMYRIYGLDPATSSPSYDLFMKCVYPADRDRVARVIEGALARREAYRVDHRITRPDGVVRTIEAQGRVVEDAGGEIRLAGTGQDVTELREAQERGQTLAARAVLHAERNRLSTLMEGVSDAFVSFDRDWRYTHVNRKAAELLHRDPGELVGKRMWDLFPDTIPVEVSEAFHRVMHTREPESIEFHFEPFDRWFEDRVYPTEEGISVVFTDITDRKRAEEATRRSEAWFRAVTENALDIITITDADGRIRYATPAGARVLGYAHGELAGANILEIVHEDDRPIAQEALACLQGSGEQVRIELRVRAADGSWQVHEVIGTSRLDDPVIRGIVLNSRDISDRRRAEEALAESEERFRLLIENAADVLHLQDLQGRVLYITPSVEPSLGYLPHELIGEPIGRIVHPEDLPRARRMVEACLGEENGCADVELRLRHADGSWSIVEVAGRNLGGCGGAERLAFYTRDVTGRRRTEEVLRRQALIFRTMSEAVVMADAEGRITEWNPAAERMFGYSREEAIGRSPAFVQPEEDRDRRAEIVRSAIEEGGWRGEFAAVHRDGRTIYCATHIVPLRGPGGEVAGTLGVTRDITERRRAEEELRQMQKMEAVGRLAGGIAHDFNNLLTALIGHTEMILLDAPEGGTLTADLREIRRAADRAAALTRQLLAFSRKQVMEPGVIDLNEVVRGAEPMLRRLLGADVELCAELGDDLWPVFADAGQMEQVLVNLAVNARDAMPEGGRIAVRTANRSLPAGDPLHPEMPPGDYVGLALTDTGTGMDAETMASSFEPFFTTKPVGAGTGLGLSTVYGIVRQSGGQIVVESEPDSGSTFTILLPRHRQGASAHPRAASPEIGKIATGEETILLVDDDEAVRALARRCLGRGGFTVLDAAGGQDALRLAQEHEGPIHLVLTDVTMPRMSGPEVAERLAGHLPGTPVLFMTGHAEGAIVERGVLEPGTHLIEKPFSPAELTAKVRELLDRVAADDAAGGLPV